MNIPKILDARSKIIQKNRAKIVDARSKLSVKDARSKISAKQNISVTRKTFNIKRNQQGVISLSTNRMKKQLNNSRSVNSTRPRSNIISDEDEEFYQEDLDSFRMKKLPPLKRTVQNDLAYVKPSLSMPPLPNFNSQRDEHYHSDPFDCYIVPTRQHVNVPKVCIYWYYK